MIFSLDENFPKSAENFLQSLGHTTYHAYQTEYQGSNDEKLFSLAQDYKAIFLTTDKDFFHTIPLKFKSHYGIIVVAISLPNRKSILEKLKWAIENLDLESFANKVVLLRDKSYTIR